MSDLTQLVVFSLDGQRFALPLDAVERIVRAVEVTPLPDAPAIVIGVMDMAGHVLPVLSLRHRFGMPEREVGPEDQLLIAWTGHRTVALVMDEAQGVIERPNTEIVGADQIVPGLEHIQGVVKLEDGLVLICDLDKFLSLDEAQDLAAAMASEAARDE